MKRLIAICLIALCSAPGFAAPAKKERKLLVTPSGQQQRRVPAALLTEGSRVMADYDAMQAIGVPEAAYDRIAEKLAKNGFEVTELENGIRTPRRFIEAGMVSPAAPYAAGLFLLQYSAPATPAWQALVRRSGVEVVESLPERAVVVTASREQAGVLARFPWVDYIGPYLAEYKHAPVGEADSTEYTIQMADTTASAQAVEELKARVGGFLTESRYGGQLTARIRTANLAAARALLDEPFVMAVEAYVPSQPSDERQSLSATTTAATPAIGASYLNWLAARGITPNALTNSGIVVDVADSGVDLGCINNANRHRDLVGRVVYNNDLLGGTTDRRDTYGHGTVVATIVGGNPVAGVNSAGGATAGFNQKDSDGYGAFYYGLGVAPGIRIGSTRKNTGTSTAGTVAQWTTAAVTSRCNTPTTLCPAAGVGPVCPATVQNHSTNEYTTNGSNAGVYTLNAREMDISVRNADRATGIQLALTVSAGNYNQNGVDPTTQVMASATAKNVISMGATESARTTSGTCLTDGSAGDRPEIRNLAQGYNTVAYTSRRGTNDGRIKPDLVAPATLSLGAKSRGNNNSYCMTGGDFFGDGTIPAYHGASGTSFAAPVAAGSIALLRYYYSTNYGFTPSPAMYKAMLVAGAKSITGGLDRHETTLMGTTRLVGKWPNAQQGFGRIALDDLLSSSVVKSWHDQQTILLQGQYYQPTVTVADPTKPMKIVLAWTDAPAAAGASITEVNGLKLTALSYHGNYTGDDGYSRIPPGCGRPVCVSPSDSRNNVEVIHIPASVFTDVTKRTFPVRVMASPLNGIGVPGQSGGANNQDFALFVLNGTLQ